MKSRPWSKLLNNHPDQRLVQQVDEQQLFSSWKQNSHSPGRRLVEMEMS